MEFGSGCGIQKKQKITLYSPGQPLPAFKNSVDSMFSGYGGGGGGGGQGLGTRHRCMVDDQDTPVKSGSVNNLSHQSSKDEPPSIKNGPERLINLMLVWWTNIKIKIYGNSFPFPFHVIMKLLCFQALLGGILCSLFHVLWCRKTIS